MTDELLHVVLVEPEIPPNTGNVGRLCLGVGARLHVVHPIGFSMDDKAARRAGLDYWPHVPITEHADADAFWRWAEDRPVALFSSHGADPFFRCPYQRGHVLVFGKESVGLPKAWVDARGGYHIPMMPGPVRSLNLSNAAAVVVYEATRQLAPEWGRWA